MFEKRMLATWGDMDFNGHMRNTAFLDKSADIRLMFFAEHGLPIEHFVRLGIGPVVRKDDIEYFREIRLLEEMRVTLATAGLSEDGARFVMRNEFWRSRQLAGSTRHQLRRLAGSPGAQAGGSTRDVAGGPA